MKITWFAIDCNLYTHPKMLRLSASLKTDVDTLVGKLGRLWAWAKLSGNENGEIGELPAQEIADIMRWKKGSKTLLSALIDCGFIDASEDGIFLHGWAELNGNMTAKKRRDNDRKKKESSTEKREKFHGNSTEIPRKIPGVSEEFPRTQYSTVQYIIQDKEISSDEDIKKADLGVVMSAYMDRINPNVSEQLIAEMQGFLRTMGKEVCLRAIQHAQDERKSQWSYVRGILRTKQSQGVRCLADWNAVEAQRETSGAKKPEKQGENGNIFAEMLREEGGLP